MRQFIAINLKRNVNGTNSRWAVCEVTADGLSPLWGIRNGDVKGKAGVQYPHQVYSKNRNFPAYHFVVEGYGHNHLDTLARDLAEHFGEPIQVTEATGYYNAFKTYEPGSYRPGRV